MPIVDCIRHEGKIYCYDDSTGLVNVYKVATVKLGSCPRAVLEALIKNEHAKAMERQCSNEISALLRDTKE